MTEPMAERVLMEALKVGVQQSVGNYVAESLTVGRVQEELLDRMTYQLTAKLLATQTARDNHVYSVEFPATWWQHLKHAHAPEWFKRRHPVRYEITKVEADFQRYATYPHADVVLPPARFGYPVTVEVASTRITSPWDTRRAQSRESRPVWVSRSELIYRLASTRATSARYGLATPAAIAAVLDGLAELGVNPDELVPNGWTG